MMSDQIPGSDLPRWLRASIVALLALTLVGNIVADIFVLGYDGQFVSMMLGGLVGTAIGVEKLIRRRGGD